MKDNLLILFGEYRTFETAFYQLKELDKCDILFITWEVSEIWPEDGKFCSHEIITESKIKNINKDIEVIILERNEIYYQPYNFKKMVYNWKTAINHVKNGNLYKRVILHRCDTASNYHLLLDKNFEDGVLYLEPGEFSDEYGFWLNDYMFAGKYDILQRFINLINYNELTINHFPLGNVVLKNNLKYKDVNSILESDGIIFATQIIKNNKEHINYFKKLNEKNLKFVELEIDSELWMESFNHYQSEIPPQEYITQN